MWKDVEKYVRECKVCAIAKAPELRTNMGSL